MNAKKDLRFMLVKKYDEYCRYSEISMDNIIKAKDQPEIKELAQKAYFDNKKGAELTKYLIECVDKYRG